MVLRRAQVLFKDKQAGLIQELDSGATVFTYGDQWDHDIACALPIAESRIFTAVGLHPVFQNLGPEGSLRDRQARAGHVDQQDDFGLLIRYGADCIGAISIVPDAAESNDISISNDGMGDPPGGRRTVSGVQEKVLAWKTEGSFKAATRDSPATHIAKFAPQHHPELLRNELHTLALAQEILGAKRVTRFERGEIDGMGYALLVERFDRARNGDKLRMEDFAQILERRRLPDFSGKYVGSYEEVAEAIKRHSVRGQIDLLEFFAALTFCLIVGNADAHLKNWSLLERPEGLRLSPQYDLLNTLIYGGDFDRSTALSICDESPQIENVDTKLLFEFCRRIGLSEKSARRKFVDLKNRFHKSKTLEPPSAEEPGGFHDRYNSVVRAACRRIFDQA